MAIGYCVECGGRIYLGDKPWIGQAAYCRRCGADLEVIRVNPPELEWIGDLDDEESELAFDRKFVPA
jgi:lysine biosynthesis protein LysW